MTEQTIERKYTKLAFRTDDFAPKFKPQIKLGEDHDDFEKLQQEFGASFDPGPDRPRVFLRQPNFEDDDEFMFLDFDDEEDAGEKATHSPFLENIRTGAAISKASARVLIIAGIFVVGYILVRCIQKIVE